MLQQRRAAANKRVDHEPRRQVDTAASPCPGVTSLEELLQSSDGLSSRDLAMCAGGIFARSWSTVDGADFTIATATTDGAMVEAIFADAGQGLPPSTDTTGMLTVVLVHSSVPTFTLRGRPDLDPKDAMAVVLPAPLDSIDAVSMGGSFDEAPFPQLAELTTRFPTN